MQGIAEDTVHLTFAASGFHSAGGVNAFIGIGVDSVTTQGATRWTPLSLGSSFATIANAVYDSVPSAGYHFLQLLERAASTGTTTFMGIGGDSLALNGATGHVFA